MKNSVSLANCKNGQRITELMTHLKECLENEIVTDKYDKLRQTNIQIFFIKM